MHCNWIRGTADSEGASRSLPRQRIYISILFLGVCSRARPLPPYSFSARKSGEWKSKNDDRAAKREKKKFVGRRERAELPRPAILAVLTFFQKRDAPPRAILEVETLVAKDPRRKHDSQLMISSLDKDMETLPRQDASTPVLRQIN